MIDTTKLLIGISIFGVMIVFHLLLKMCVDYKIISESIKDFAKEKKE